MPWCQVCRISQRSATWSKRQHRRMRCPGGPACCKCRPLHWKISRASPGLGESWRVECGKPNRKLPAPKLPFGNGFYKSLINCYNIPFQYCGNIGGWFDIGFTIFRSMEYKFQEFCCRNSDITELRSPQPDADEKSEVARLACRIHHSAKELRFCPKVESEYSKSPS